MRNQFTRSFAKRPKTGIPRIALKKLLNITHRLFAIFDIDVKRCHSHLISRIVRRLSVSLQEMLLSQLKIFLIEATLGVLKMQKVGTLKVFGSFNVDGQKLMLFQPQTLDRLRRSNHLLALPTHAITHLLELRRVHSSAWTHLPNLLFHLLDFSIQHRREIGSGTRDIGLNGNRRAIIVFGSFAITKHLVQTAQHQVKGRPIILDIKRFLQLRKRPVKLFTLLGIRISRS